MIDDEDDLGLDDGDEGEAAVSPADANTSLRDVEQAVIDQKADKGHPEPTRGFNGRQLQGRQDTGMPCGMVGDALRQNFAGGVEKIAARFGLDPRQVAATLAQKYLGPEAPQAMQQYPRRLPDEQLDAKRARTPGLVTAEQGRDADFLRRPGQGLRQSRRTWQADDARYRICLGAPNPLGRVAGYRKI
jgi:hypothetical protein